MQRWLRVVLALAFLTAALGLCVAGEATYEDRWPYPTSESIVADYDTHVGEETFLFGTVESVTEDGVTIFLDEGSQGLLLSVQNVDVSIEPGGVVQVTGRLQPDHVIQATDIVVVNTSPGAKLWKYATSLVGLVGFLGLFFRYWRIAPRDLLVEGRNDG